MYLPASLIVVLLAAALNSCSSTDPNNLTFVRNAETVERVFRAFEAEDGKAFGAEFAETAVWRGTGVNSPSTLPRQKMNDVYDALWAEFDYRIVSDLHFQPGVNPETLLPNGSVNGVFCGRCHESMKTVNDVPFNFGFTNLLTSMMTVKSSTRKSFPTSLQLIGSFGKPLMNDLELYSSQIPPHSVLELTMAH